MIDGQVLFLNLKLPLEHVRVATVSKQGAVKTLPLWLPLEHVRVATVGWRKHYFYELPLEHVRVEHLFKSLSLPLEHVRVATQDGGKTALELPMDEVTA